MIVDGFTVRQGTPFAIASDGHMREYFASANPQSTLTITGGGTQPLEPTIRTWPEAAADERIQTESGSRARATVQQVVSGLAPNAAYRLSCNGAVRDSLLSDASGHLAFDYTFDGAVTQHFVLKPE